MVLLLLLTVAFLQKVLLEVRYSKLPFSIHVLNIKLVKKGNTRPRLSVTFIIVMTTVGESSIYQVLSCPPDPPEILSYGEQFVETSRCAFIIVIQ